MKYLKCFLFVVLITPYKIQPAENLITQQPGEVSLYASGAVFALHALDMSRDPYIEDSSCCEFLCCLGCKSICCSAASCIISAEFAKTTSCHDPRINECVQVCAYGTLLEILHTIEGRIFAPNRCIKKKKR